MDNVVLLWSDTGHQQNRLFQYSTGTVFDSEGSVMTVKRMAPQLQPVNGNDWSTSVHDTLKKCVQKHVFTIHLHPYRKYSCTGNDRNKEF